MDSALRSPGPGLLRRRGVGQVRLRRLGVAFTLTVLGAWAGGTFLTQQAPTATTSRLDQMAQDVVSLHRISWLQEAMRFVTAFGNDGPMAVLFILGALWAYRSTRDRRWPMLFLFAMVGGLVLDNVIKPIVARPRPDFERLVGGNGFSFPSGHVTATAALCAVVAYFLIHRKGAPPLVTWTLGGVVVVAMAFSRIYLGVHWPTDVIGASILGSAWAVVSTAIAGLRSPAHDLYALIERPSGSDAATGTALT